MVYKNKQLLIDNIYNLMERVSEIAGNQYIAFVIDQYQARSIDELQVSSLEDIFILFHAIVEGDIY